MRDRILKIVRDSVDRGLTVEIEGLGTFLPGEGAGGYRFEPQSRPQVFVAYAAEDLKLARRLSASLERAGCAPWLDKDKLLPGQNWPRALERAIENSDAFLACFSRRSIAKRGHFQSELRYALDCARRLPLDQLFVVPVRFERCAVPRLISDRVQYVDLFPDWEGGLERVLRAVHRSSIVRPTFTSSGFTSGGLTSNERSATDCCNRRSRDESPA